MEILQIWNRAQPESSQQNVRYSFQKKNFFHKKKDLIERAKVNKLKAILNKEKMDRSYCRHRVGEVVGEVWPL